jgi:hypothetical protein
MTEPEDLARLGRDYAINFKDLAMPRPTIAELEATNAKLLAGLDRAGVERKTAVADRNELLTLAKDLLDQLVLQGRQRNQICTRDGRLAVDLIHLYD